MVLFLSVESNRILEEEVIYIYGQRRYKIESLYLKILILKIPSTWNFCGMASFDDGFHKPF